MNSLTAPSTPNQHPVIHRSFTLPARLSGSARHHGGAKTVEPDAIETLFTHHAARIITFNALSTSSQSRSGSSTAESVGNDELAGTLPWANHSERIIAAGTYGFLDSRTCNFC